MSADNKQIVRRIFEDYVSAPSPELLNELLAEDYVGMTSGAPPTGRAQFAATIQALRAAFPDLRYSIEDLVEEGDLVAVRWQWTGTHRGVFKSPFGTFEPTGKQVSNDGAAVYQMKNGRAVRASLLTDRLGFLQHVGAIPGPRLAK
jgi:predicted ester cyclase